MPSCSQGKLRGLCLSLLALVPLACQDEPAAPAGQDPRASLPFWALCENWQRRDKSCDQAVLLADHEVCMRTESLPTRQRLLEARVARLARRRAEERTTIVCLERRAWMLTEAGFRNLPGRPQQAAPPS